MPSYEPEVERLVLGQSEAKQGADWTDHHTHIRDILGHAALALLRLPPEVAATIPPAELTARLRALKMLKDAVPGAYAK